MLDQVREKIENGNPQAIDGMEQAEDQQNDLNDPVAKQGAGEIHPQQRKNIEGKENEQCAPTNAMQNVCQVWTSSPIAQPCSQADVPFQTHGNLHAKSLIRTILFYPLIIRNATLKQNRALMGAAYR